MNRHPSSYGIDCSGFVCESAYLTGITGIPSAWGYTAGDLMSASQAVDVDSFNYLRPGDFVAWGAHTFYVAAPSTVDESGEEGIDTLEAQPNVVGNELGRTRYGRRDKADLLRIKSGVKWRRWVAP